MRFGWTAEFTISVGMAGFFWSLPFTPSKGKRDNDFGKKLDSADPEGATCKGWGAAQSMLSGS